MFDRRLSHVKLTFVPGQRRQREGVLRLWTRVDARQPTAEAMPRPAHRRAATAVAAVDAAVDWLLAARHQGGWWRDFAATPAVGFSDEWVTAYVGDALAGMSVPRAHSAANDALELLLTRRGDGDGWGFNVQLPADGDATTWALRLAQSLGSTRLERLEAGRRAALRVDDTRRRRHQLSRRARLRRWIASCSSGAPTTGGSTLTCASPLLRHDSASIRPPPGTSGRRRTATAPGRATGGRMTNTRRRGRWRRWLASAEDDSAVAGGVGWCAGRIGDDGAVRSRADGQPAVFPTALALYAIRVGGTGGGDGWRAAADRAERWLLEQQLADGSWEASARMRVPAPSIHDPSASPDQILRYVGDPGSGPQPPSSPLCPPVRRLGGSVPAAVPSRRRTLRARRRR